MNVDSDKPRYLECIYEAPITFDLEELGIDWENVKDYYIKYGTLYVNFKDGTSQEHWGDIGEPDYKWATKELILTEDYDLVEGLN
jgi:hypothetical protein